MFIKTEDLPEKLSYGTIIYKHEHRRLSIKVDPSWSGRISHKAIALDRGKFFPLTSDDSLINSYLKYSFEGGVTWLPPQLFLYPKT